MVARRDSPRLSRVPQRLAQAGTRRGGRRRSDGRRERHPQPARFDAASRDPGDRIRRPWLDPDLDRGTGRGHFCVSQNVSEHQFNTAGLNPWGGLQPPAAGAAPDIRILGVPMDRGSFYRPGAAKAPAELRKLSAIFAPVSEQAELFDPVMVQADGGLKLVDGDMGANVDAVAAEIERTPKGPLPIVLGGDHTTASPTLVAQQRRLNGRLSILSIEAHPDLNDSSRDSRGSTR